MSASPAARPSAPEAAEGAARERLPTLERDGYALLPDLLDAGSVAKLRRDLASLCRESHDDACAALKDAAGASDEVLLAHFTCLQFPHLVSQHFLRALLHPEILAELRRAIGPDLKLAQSIVLTRPAGTPGLAWHQDRHYLQTDGPLVGVWIALDDARIDNGCLWVLPASHGPAEVWCHQKAARETQEIGPRVTGHPFREEEALALRVDAGGCVLFDGYVLHRSLQNRRASGLRRSLIGHFSRAGAPSPWDAANRRVSVADGSCVEVVTGATAFAHCTSFDGSAGGHAPV